MKTIIRNCLVCFLLLIGMIFLALENQIGGFRTFIVSSSSMEPTIDTGSLIITRYVHPHTLQRGDTITFIPPTRDREFVTHRIIGKYDEKNLFTFKTKGDNNKNEDPWILAEGGIVGKVFYSMPHLGFLLSFIKSKIGIIFLVLLPAVYIIIDELLTIMRTIKTHKKNTTSIPPAT